MDPSRGNPREYLRQALNAVIESLEEPTLDQDTRKSVRAVLRRRYNALTPVSSLPTEVITIIFTFLRFPATSPPVGKYLEWLRAAHVCHRWREIALNLPLFWSHVDFSKLTLTNAAEMLSRAKMAPLHLHVGEGFPIGFWVSWFYVFEGQVQPHLSQVYHLTVTTTTDHLRGTIERLVSPAPMLECLSLSHTGAPISVPDTLFDGTTPRLTCLELCNCDISWKSPLFKGLKSLELQTVSLHARPTLADWLDALKKLSQLERLLLHSASPILPSHKSKRTVTLPSLTHLDISDSARDCELMLAHLVLPALTCLRVTVQAYLPNGNDVQSLLPYVARCAHGPQDPGPLQSMLIRGDGTHPEILAWTVPGIGVGMHDPHALPTATRSARVELSAIGTNPISIVGAAMAVLPLDSLVTLTVQRHIQLDEQFWLSCAPRWPLLRRVRLASGAVRGFREMLLQQDHGGGGESPLLSSLTNLDLIDNTVLTAHRTLRLCDALMHRVERGVPLEALDLSACLATSHAVRLLSGIVADVCGPAETLETKEHNLFIWNSATRGHFVYVFGVKSEGYDYLDDDDEDAPIYRA